MGSEAHALGNASSHHSQTLAFILTINVRTTFNGIILHSFVRFTLHPAPAAVGLLCPNALVMTCHLFL